jgi:hypothetical protein
MQTYFERRQGFRHPLARALAALTLLAWVSAVVAVFALSFWREESPAPPGQSAQEAAVPAVFVGVLASAAESALARGAGPPAPPAGP